MNIGDDLINVGIEYLLSLGENLVFDNCGNVRVYNNNNASYHELIDFAKYVKEMNLINPRFNF